MRKLLLLAAVVLTTSVKLKAQVLGDPVVTWDFANGIPEDWIVGINSTTDLAHWEYRGPSTTPNTTVGARGSCSALAVPLLSQTQSNGFVIFDGNYWDDSGNLCGLGLGTGVDPAPHTAWLITPPIDLSSAVGPVLTFQQQYRSYLASTKVQISTDLGLNWTDILVNSGPQSPNSIWASVNLASYTTGESSVQFKFLYEGTYYWWLLDDISVYIPNQNDLMLTKKSYTNNSGPDTPNALFNLEYDQYPITQIPTFNFKGSCVNVGSLTQHDVTLNTRIVQNGAAEVFNDNSGSPDVEAFATQNLTIPGNYTNAPVQGEYVIYYTFTQDEADETPLNNIDSLDYSITEFTYALDEGPMENTYVPNSTFNPYEMEAGCFYQAFHANTYCYSIGVGVAEGTTIGSGLRGRIYNQAMDTILATTNSAVVNYGDLNEPGDEKMITLDFSTPFELIEDSLYFVAVYELDSTLDLRIARSGITNGESGLIRFPHINATLLSAKIPMVRMHVFSAGVVPGCTDPLAMDYEPGAQVEDGSCHYPGCTNEDADNYTPGANYDDGTCVVGGCTDQEAANYNPDVNYDNGSCQYPGCTDQTAVNYNPDSNVDNGSCQFIYAHIHATSLAGCAPLTFHITNNNEFVEGSTCNFQLNTDQINETCQSQFDYTITQPGSYELYYQFSINNALADTTISILVYDDPAPSVITYDNENYVLSCTNCGSDAYSWYLDGSSLSGTANSDLDIFFNNNYQNGYYSIRRSNEQGCTNFSDDFLVIQPHFLTNVDEACQPVQILATDLTDEVLGSTCTIDFGDGNPSEPFENVVEHFYTQAGTYQITVTCENNGTTGTYTLPLEVHEVILPQIVHNSLENQVECTNCGEFAEVEWLIDGVNNSGNGPFPGGNHLYQVTGVTAFDCAGTSLLVLISADENASQSITAYPIPANETLHITGVQVKPGDLQLMDLTGRNVECTFQSTGNGGIFNTSALAAGRYVLTLRSGDQVFHQQIEITH